MGFQNLAFVVQWRMSQRPYANGLIISNSQLGTKTYIIFEPLCVPDVVRLLKFDSGYPTLINNLCLHGNRERDRKHIKTNNLI
jgi:hypothetical protein